MTYLSTPWYEKNGHPAKESGGDYKGEIWDSSSPYEHNYNDSDSDIDYSSSDSSIMTRDLEATSVDESQVQEGHKGVWEYTNSNVQRFPAILRTNRQVYSEASTILYGELGMHLHPGDVLCMNTGKDIVKASEKVWRHNPLQGTGTISPSGQTVYSKPELDGVMEPHVFARFKKIVFNLDFGAWESEALRALSNHRAEDQDTQDPFAPTLFVNENLTVNPEDEAKLLAFYRRSTLFYQFVKILSNSPNIVLLDINLYIEVLAKYDMSHIGLDWDSEEDEDEDEAEEVDKKTAAANKRAVDLFLDSGLLAPLAKLSNVRSFKFVIEDPDCNFDMDEISTDDTLYKPKPKHERMLNDLKLKIERNYAAKDD